MTLDGIGKYLSEIVEKDDSPTDDIVGILKERKVDVVVCYLPVGSEDAVKWYAEQIMAAGCAMVNCMPVFIAREDYWNKRFQEAGVPIIGDDIKSQVGATIHAPRAHLALPRARRAPRQDDAAQRRRQTRTSSTCSSANASNRRRSRRPTP